MQPLQPTAAPLRSWQTAPSTAQVAAAAPPALGGHYRHRHIAATTPRSLVQQLPAAAASPYPSSSRSISSSRFTSFSSRQRRAAVSTAAAAVSEAAEQLEPSEQQQWAAAAAVLQERCTLDAEAADAVLLKAFGWKGQGFWRQERVKDVPCPAQVAAALDFLEDLGIAGPEALGPLVSTFPEALGLRVELMQENVQVLRDKWYMKVRWWHGSLGNTLVNTIKRKPKVLGNSIDCEGNCAGLCTRCWAQF